MRKYLKILLLLLLAGCAVQHTPVTTDTVTVTREMVRDSLVIIPPDSAWLKAWFECDSMNQVVMTELEESKGKTIRQEAVFESSGAITINARVDSQAIYLAWKERHDTATITNTVIKTVEVEKVVRKTPAWLLWLAGLGAGAIVIMIILVVIMQKAIKR